MTTQTTTQANCCQTESQCRPHDGAGYSPRVDIVETSDKLLLYADLPGVAADDLNIRYEDRELVIEGKVTARQNGQKWLSREYGVGDFHRAFSVGDQVDTDRIEAELKDGVLVVHLPKTEQVKPRRISVQAN